jgi:hypothetical protein
VVSIWKLLRPLFLIVTVLIFFIFIFFVAGIIAYPFGPYGFVAVVFVMLGAYFLVGRWLFRRL